VNDSTSVISPAWPTRWPKNSFKSVWAWLLAGFLAALFVLTFVVSIANPPVQNVSAGLLDIALGAQFGVEALLVALVLGTLPALSGFTLRALGFRVPDTTTVGIALLGAVAMVIVSNGSAALIDYFSRSQHPQDIVQIFKHLHDPTTIAVFAVFAVLFAPFAEETFFRIFFFNFGLRYGGFWGGTLLSGILFGIAHGDPYAALPLALGGVVLCAVYYRTANAFAPMISHALFNALSIVVLLAVPKIT
jgi:membrane protease YdiL (CAAX protease family)